MLVPRDCVEAAPRPSVWSGLGQRRASAPHADDDGALDPTLARLSFKHLLYLRALVAERSVAGAARRMNVSPSSMSGALARLQRAFGDPILLPHEGGPRAATPLARQLALCIDQMVDSLGCSQRNGFKG